MNVSTVSLVLSNIAMYYFAKTEQWSFSTILLAYWLQSVVIGFFQVLRILRLKDFTVKGVKINGSEIPDNSKSKLAAKTFTAIFFSIHYGMFHFVYLIFIVTQMFGKFHDIGAVKVWGVTISGVLITTVIFFMNHLVSYLKNPPEGPETNIGNMMFAPYIRIIPMHLTIIFGAMFKIPLEIFMSLKTLADVVQHIGQHKKKPIIMSVN